MFDCGADTTVNNPISGSGSLTQGGPDTLTLGGSNHYAGGTTIDAGNLAFNSTASIPGGDNSVMINQGGALNVPGPYSSVAYWQSTKMIDPSSAGAGADWRQR